tara:strand:+ start:118 stop:2142 length:2025 start_codon:yes stop_codon:yes gene_type:complete
MNINYNFYSIILLVLFSVYHVVVSNKVKDGLTWGKRDYDQVRDSPFFPPYKGDCKPPLCDTRTSTLDARGYYRVPGQDWTHRHYVTLKDGDPIPKPIIDVTDVKAGYIDDKGNVVESNKTNACPECDYTGTGLKNGDASNSIKQTVQESSDDDGKNNTVIEKKSDSENAKDSIASAANSKVVMDNILRQTMPEKMSESDKKTIKSLLNDDVKNAAMKDAVKKNVRVDGKVDEKVDTNILKTFKENLEKKEKEIEAGVTQGDNKNPIVDGSGGKDDKKDPKISLPVVNELRPPASSDKAAEHPKPKSPFSDDVKEMLAPVNPHMDSIQMVKKQMTKQHANELLAKTNLKAVLDKPMDPAKAAELKDKMEAKEKSDKGKLAIPPIPPPKPPKDEDEGDGDGGGDGSGSGASGASGPPAKQDVAAADKTDKEKKNAPTPPKTPFDKDAQVKVGPDGKAIEGMNKKAGIDADCSPVPRPTIPFEDVTGKLGRPGLPVPDTDKAMLPSLQFPCGLPNITIPTGPPDAPKPPKKKKKSCGKGLIGKLMCFIKKVAKKIKKGAKAVKDKLGGGGGGADGAPPAAGGGAPPGGGGGGDGGGGGKKGCGKNLIGKILCFVKKVAKKVHGHMKKAFGFKSESTTFTSSDDQPIELDQTAKRKGVGSWRKFKSNSNLRGSMIKNF